MIRIHDLTAGFEGLHVPGIPYYAGRARDWAIVMSNVSAAPDVRSFADVRRRLGRGLFDGLAGALPFNVRCLQLESPKLALACVGRDVREAKIILDDAKKRLAS